MKNINIKKIRKIVPLFAYVSVFFPFIVSAQGTNGCFATYQAGGKLGDLFNYFSCLISTAVIPLIFTLAFALFFWGVVQYVINDSEEAKKAKGRQFMIWGLIALFVMFTVWGIVKLLAATFGFDTGVLPKLGE
jgi:Na+/proline symporter